MKILKDSIEDKSIELNDYLKQFHSCNYVVYGDLVTFNYEGNEGGFNLKNLKEIYCDLLQKDIPDLKQPSKYNFIDGEISLVNFNEAIIAINNNLQYAPSGEGYREAKDIGLDLVRDSEYEKRKKNFWGLIQKYFTFPTDFVYRHEAYYPSYFSFYVMWGFCYIFLKNGKGLVLSAGVSD